MDSFGKMVSGLIFEWDERKTSKDLEDLDEEYIVEDNVYVSYELPKKVRRSRRLSKKQSYTSREKDRKICVINSVVNE